MPNFDDLKSTNPVYFPGAGISNVPSWDLRDENNAYNQLVDQVAMLHRTVNPADDTVIDPEEIEVGPSPFVYLAAESEQIHISGGIVASVEKWSEAEEEWVALTQALPISPHLYPAAQLRVTYTEAPLMVRDSSNFNNAAGLTQVYEPLSSPASIVAVGRATVMYVSGGLVQSIKRNGTALTQGVPFQCIIPRGGTVVIEFDESDPPYIVLDS